MERQDFQSAYDDIVAHIEKQSGKYETWYVDTADSKWKIRLFKEHKIPPRGYWWMTRQCYTNVAAKCVKDSLVELGCEAGPGSDDGRDAVYVYAYLKSGVARQGDEDNLTPKEQVDTI
jgi:hypothetical protein